MGIFFKKLSFFVVGWRWCASNLMAPHICSAQTAKTCFWTKIKKCSRVIRDGEKTMDLLENLT